MLFQLLITLIDNITPNIEMNAIIEHTACQGANNRIANMKLRIHTATTLAVAAIKNTAILTLSGALCIGGKLNIINGYYWCDR